MPCTNLGRLYIHLAFTYSVGPSNVVWSELGPAPPLPPTRVLEAYWSWALSLVCEVTLITQGTLHTRAKSRDHEIVRVQMKVFKGRPNTPPKSCSCGHRTSSVVWRHMWPSPQTKCYFNEIMGSSHMINQRLWAFGVPRSPSFVLGLPSRGGFWK
jgi:hypothetical protein